MDRVFVRGLVAKTTVGIHDWEQQSLRKVIISIEMDTDASLAADVDDIAKTVSYSAVSKRLIEYLATSKIGLIETLAEQLAGVVLREFPVNWLRLELEKPGAVPEAETVGVVIERQRPEAG